MRRTQVFVVTRDGKKNIYDADRFGTVRELKERIGRHLSVPMGFSRLTFKGHMLPNESVLEDVGIKRMSTLELAWQPLVFSPKQFREKELDMEKQEQKKLLELKKQQRAVKKQKAAGQLKKGGKEANSEQEEPAEEEESSISSEELDFLAAYRKCAPTMELPHPKRLAKPHMIAKQKGEEIEVELEDEDVDADTDIEKLDNNCELEKVATDSTFTILEESDADLDELLEHRQEVMQEMERLALEHGGEAHQTSTSSRGSGGSNRSKSAQKAFSSTSSNKKKIKKYSKKK